MKWIKWLALLLAALLVLFYIYIVPGALAADIAPRASFAALGDHIIARVSYDIPAPYHAYAHDAGESGRPTTLELISQGREGAAPAWYPPGSQRRDSFDPEASVFTYEGHVDIFALLPAEAAGLLYGASLSMLLCSDRHCLPLNERLAGHVPENPPPLSAEQWGEQALAAAASFGLRLPENDGGGSMIIEEGKAPPPVENEKLPAEQIVRPAEEELPAPDDFNLSLFPRHFSDSEVYGLWQALAFGLLAGLLLNAMPCVLPVLTLKVSGLLLGGGRGRLKKFREHNLFFAAGILSLFTILALLLGLLDLMWGQLYQSQTVLLALLLIVFLMGLSMLGVFTLPVIDLRAQSGNPRLQSYLTGLISTFLATPCSGPLLGGVLAWAFNQPLAAMVAVFWAVGLGMALPYLAFCVWPKLTYILPRPGPWMYVFEHVLGFMLLGASIYLLSILPEEKYPRILVLLLLVSACAWLWGRFCGLAAPRWRNRLCACAGLCVLVCAFFWVLRPAPRAAEWLPFSPEQFTENLGKKPMLLEFTADWCPNCKFLEAAVLTENHLRDIQDKRGITLVRVDLTRPDAYAMRLLDMLGSKSIPLTALFPAGPEADKPLVLRDIYTRRDLRDALRLVFGD